MRRPIFSTVVTSAALAAVALAGLSGTAPSPSRAQSAVTFDVLSRVGGPSHAVAAFGHDLLLGEGQQLLVVEGADAGAPRVKARSPRLGGDVAAVAVSEPLAFVALGDAGLVVLRVPDLGAPEIVGRYRGGVVWGVAYEDGRAYVSLDYGLGVLDLDDPAQPALLGRLPRKDLELGFRNPIAVRDGIVWTRGYAGLLAIDARNPPAMPLLSATLSGRGIGWIAIADDRAYVVNTVRGVTVVDISDPTSPRELASLGQNLLFARHSTLVGNRLYVACGGNGVSVFEVGDASVRRQGTLATAGPASSVAVQGNLLFVALEGTASATGLQVFRDNRPQAMLPTLGWVQGVAVSNGRALLAAGALGLAVVDVSDPWSARETGRADTPGVASRVAAAGTLALVADGTEALGLYNVTDPGRPVRVGAFAAGAPVLDVAAERDLAVAASQRAVHVLDLGDPAGPKEISRIEGRDSRIELSNGRALTIGSHFVIDLSDPARPRVRGGWGALRAPPPQGVAGHGDQAYFGATVSGYSLWTPMPGVTATPPPDEGHFYVVDLTDPDAPALRGDLVLGYVVSQSLSVLAVDPDHGRVYAAGDRSLERPSPLVAIDVTDPDRPLLNGGASLLAGDLVYRDGLLYAAALDGGLWILRPHAPDDPTPTPTPSATPTRASAEPMYLPRVGSP